MTPHDQMHGSESVTAALPPARRSQRFGLWFRRLAISAGILVAAFIGIWSVWTEPVSLPEIPEINTKGFDPEIAAAIQRTRFAVEQNPQSKIAWGELAMVLHAHGFENQAVICYSAATALDPDNYLWPYLQGIVLYKSATGPVAALPCFERAVRISPAQLIPRLWLAEMLLELDRLDEASNEFEHVLSVDPYSDRAQFGLGKLAVSRRQYRKALSYLQSVAKNPSARKNSAALRVVVYERLGDRESSERERRQLAELPQDGSWPDEAATQINNRRVGLVARLQQVRVMGIQGRNFDAISLLQDTAQLYPESDETWFSLGKVFYISMNPLGSKQALKKCLELVPDHAECLFILGHVELQLREYQEAATSFRRAIELKPQNGQAYFGLGECLQALGDLKGAADAYRQALVYSPNDKLARERLEKLSDQP